MSRCARCNKFMFLSSKSGFCKDCQVLNAMETAEQERKVREEAERKFQEEEAKRYAEDAQRQKAEEARKAEEKRRRLAEEAQIAEEERRRQAADARKAEEERKLKAAEERKAEEERHHKVAEARKAEEKRKHEVEEIIKANEERKREETKNNASPKAFTHSLEIGDTIKFGKYIQGVGIKKIKKEYIGRIKVYSGLSTVPRRTNVYNSTCNMEPEPYQGISEFRVFIQGFHC